MKIIRNLFGIVTILVISMLMTGYRLTPLSAANAVNLVTKNHAFIEAYGDDNERYYLYERDDDKEFLTVLVKKKWFTYLSTAVTSIPYNDEELHTVGGMTNIISKSGQSSLIIRNTSENVDYIKFETKEGEEEVLVSKDSYTFVSIPVNTKSVVIKAFDNHNKNSYYYTLNHDTILSYLRWKPVE